MGKLYRLGIFWAMRALRPRVHYGFELSPPTNDYNLIILITIFVYTYCRASYFESNDQRILEFDNEIGELYRLGIPYTMVVLRPEIHHSEELSPTIIDHNLIILIATFVYIYCRASYCELYDQRIFEFDNETGELLRVGILHYSIERREPIIFTKVIFKPEELDQFTFDLQK